MKTYSTEIAEAIKEALEAEDMHLVAFDEKKGCFGFAIHIRGPISFVDYVINVNMDDYIVIAHCPVKLMDIDSTALAAMAEFVCRANHGLKNGNFELDFEDGELRYKCFVDCDGGQIPSQEIIHDSIAIPASMIKRYASGIIGVLFRDMKAETAIEECESSKRIFRDLAEAERKLDALLKKHDNAEEASKQDDVADDDKPIPSFIEFLQSLDRMRDSENDEFPDDSSDDNEGSSVG